MSRPLGEPSTAAEQFPSRSSLRSLPLVRSRTASLPPLPSCRFNSCSSRDGLVSEAQCRGPLVTAGIASGTTRPALFSCEKPGFRPVACLNRHLPRRGCRGLEKDLRSAHLPISQGVRTVSRRKRGVSPRGLTRRGSQFGDWQGIPSHFASRFDPGRDASEESKHLCPASFSPTAALVGQLSAVSRRLARAVALESTASFRFFGPALGIDARFEASPSFEDGGVSGFQSTAPKRDRGPI